MNVIQDEKREEKQPTKDDALRAIRRCRILHNSTIGRELDIIYRVLEELDDDE